MVDQKLKFPSFKELDSLEKSIEKEIPIDEEDEKSLKKELLQVKGMRISKKISKEGLNSLSTPEIRILEEWFGPERWKRLNLRSFHYSSKNEQKKI